MCTIPDIFCPDLVLMLICSTVRFVRFPSSKVVALRLLQRFSRFTDDETRLQRVIPFVVLLLGDTSPTVRCTALRVLTTLLDMVKTLPISDHGIFPEYLFPAIARFKVDAAPCARLALAECLPRLAETSAKFLGLARLRQKEEEKKSYNAQLGELQNIVLDYLSNMIEQSGRVRCALMRDITRLCLFFGREKTCSNVLPIVITFLNTSEWELRATFFQHLPGVCALVGPIALGQFLVPCIVQSLQDSEQLVVESTLTCLYTLSVLGLLDCSTMKELVTRVGPLTCHPGRWIQHGSIRLLAALVSSDRLGFVQVQATVVAALLPFLSTPSGSILLGRTKDISENEALLRGMLYEPLGWDEFRAALARHEIKSSLSSSPPPSGAACQSHSEQWVQLNKIKSKQQRIRQPLPPKQSL